MSQYRKSLNNSKDSKNIKLSDFPEEAIPLLTFDPVKKIFTLTEQGEELIRSIKGEFAVISVAGMYRTGKSYLLNQMLLNRSKGFSVGPTVNPCTKGLWIWTKPIMTLDTQINTKCPILLIDTEGFGAFDEDQNHDIKIFTLAVLLSSYFIYNSMGSIDENAIQSLSFVINLSKNIQLKGKQESDPEDLSALFPSFLWLVRDFSLQLVDDDGDSITPKEYLEKVLDTSKSTYDIDDKTKIRKLIKNYFKDRDCHTMVRPITDETKLQDLASIPSEKLRPDFMEAIIHLRKKIASKIKPKTFNKKVLTGDMYLNMINSFIEAINKGAVPNIENTWSSMCKVECQKALEISEAIYESYLKDNLGDTLSGTINTIEYIQGVHRVAKENALATFKKKSLGDSNEDYVQQLKGVFKEKLKFYEEQAEEANKKEMFKKLKQFYAYFENKVYNPKSTEDEITVERIEEELKKMEYKINERFGDFHLKNELFNEFKANVFFFIGSFIRNNCNIQLEQLKTEKEELTKKLQEDVEEQKNNTLKELKKKNSLIEQIKTELLENKENYSNLKHKLITTEKDLDILEKQNNDKNFKQKDEHERKMNILQKTNLVQDEKVRDSERKVIQIENEKTKEIALLEQKNQHISKQVEDLKKFEKDSGVELKSQLKEVSMAMKGSNQKYEKQIKTLSDNLENYKEQLVDTDSNLKKTETMFEAEKERNLELEAKIKSLKEENDEKINNMNKKLENEKNKITEELNQREKDNNFTLNKSKISSEEQDLKYKNMEEDLKNQISQLKRELSVANQNHEFLEDKHKESQAQLEENKKNHEAVVARLESKTFSMIGNEEYSRKLDEIKIFYEKEKLQSEEMLDNQKKIYSKQIDHLSETKNELEIRMKNEIDGKDKQLNQLSAKYEKSQKEIKNLTNEKKNLTESLNEAHDEMNEKFKEMLSENEKRMDEKEYSHHKEREDFNSKSEDTLKQLKMIYETDKIRVDEKLKEEKNKNDRKIKQLTNEYDEKIREMNDEGQNEYYNLEEEYKALEQRSLTYESQAENEINLLSHKCETLEKNVKDFKETQDLTIINHKKAVDLLQSKLDKERKDNNEKIESQQKEINNLEKEILLLKSNIERLEGVIKDKEEYVLKLRAEIEEEKKELQSKLDEYNKKYQEGTDKFLQEKMDIGKDNAVLRQQVEFSKKKCEELKDQLEGNQSRYEERLFSLRNEVESDNTERFEKLNIAKEEVEKKLLSKRKDMKEAEQNFVKQINGVEKEMALYKEKLSSLEQSKKDAKESYEKEIASLSFFSSNIKGDYQKELGNYLQNSEQLKQKVQNLTTELLEARSNTDKDKLLWENKFKFLEALRDNYKHDLLENQKKFDSTLDNIQTKNMEEKEKIEKTLTDKINSIENKYTLQIKDANDKHTNLYSELLKNSKNLEKENKNLKIELDLKIKNFDPTASQKQIEELQNDLDRLKEDLDNSKKSNLTKNSDIRNQMEREKDSLKSKLNDIESKLKDTESKRSHTLFEVELERGKWHNEKEHLLSNISDLKEQLENIQLKCENLTRDKMKLQNEKSAMGRGKGITGSSRMGQGIGSSIGGSRGLSNPYGNFVSGGGKNNLISMDKGLDKILDGDTSGIGLTNSSFISSSHKGENFNSNKFKSQYGKTNNKENDLDDIDFNDK